MVRNLIELQFRSLARKSEPGFSIKHVLTYHTHTVERIGFYQKYCYTILLRANSEFFESW